MKTIKTSFRATIVKALTSLRARGLEDKLAVSNQSDLVDRELERYYHLIANGALECAGEFNAADKAVLLRAMEGFSVGMPEMLDVLAQHVFNETAYESSEMRRAANGLFNKITGLSQTARMSLVDAIERHQLAALHGSEPSLDAFIDEGQLSRTQRLRALHEAGHAFMVVFMGNTQLKNVAVYPYESEPEVEGVRAGGYYSHKIAENMDKYLQDAEGFQRYVEDVIPILVAGGQAQRCFENEIPIMADDAIAPRMDYIQATSLLTELLLHKGFTLHQERFEIIHKRLDATEDAVYNVFMSFRGCLRELWSELVMKNSLSGEQVAEILRKHNALER